MCRKTIIEPILKYLALELDQMLIDHDTSGLLISTHSARSLSSSSVLVDSFFLLVEDDGECSGVELWCRSLCIVDLLGV